MKMEPGTVGTKAYGDFGGFGVTVVGHVLRNRQTEQKSILQKRRPRSSWVG